MGCFIEKEVDKLIATLIFNREQLLYDIRNSCYIEGHIQEKDNPHQRHTIQDVGEEGNVDRITRILDLRVAKCRELLYPYTKHDVRRRHLDDKLKDRPLYGVVLALPKEFSQTTLNLIKELIHEYLVSCSVSEWLSISNPEKAEIWAQKAEDTEKELKSCLNARVCKARIRLCPF